MCQKNTGSIRTRRWLRLIPKQVELTNDFFTMIYHNMILSYISVNRISLDIFKYIYIKHFTQIIRLTNFRSHFSINFQSFTVFHFCLIEEIMLFYSTLCHFRSSYIQQAMSSFLNTFNTWLNSPVFSRS